MRTSWREHKTSWIASSTRTTVTWAPSWCDHLRDLLHVEDGVGASGLLRPHRRHRARGGAQGQHWRSDLDAAVHGAVACPDRAQPAGADREAFARLPRQVEVPLAAVVAVQRLDIHASHGARNDGIRATLPSRLIASVPAVRAKNEPCRSSQGLLRTKASSTGSPASAWLAAQRAAMSPPVEWPLTMTRSMAVARAGYGRALRRARRSTQRGRGRSSASGEGAGTARTCAGRERRSRSQDRRRSRPSPSGRSSRRTRGRAGPRHGRQPSSAARLTRVATTPPSESSGSSIVSWVYGAPSRSVSVTSPVCPIADACQPGGGPAV